MGEPVDDDLLDGDPVVVGIEADVAEEDAVCVRDRRAAQLGGLRAAVAVGEVAQALTQLGRRRARAGVDEQRVQGQAGELVGEPGIDAQRSVPRSRTISRSVADPSVVLTTRPPLRAKVIVGQTATAYSLATAPSRS